MIIGKCSGFSRRIPLGVTVQELGEDQDQGEAARLRVRPPGRPLGRPRRPLDPGNRALLSQTPGSPPPPHGRHRRGSRAPRPPLHQIAGNSKIFTLLFPIRVTTKLGISLTFSAFVAMAEAEAAQVLRVQHQRTRVHHKLLQISRHLYFGVTFMQFYFSSPYRFFDLMFLALAGTCGYWIWSKVTTWKILVGLGWSFC